MSFAGAGKILEFLQHPEGFVAKQEIKKRTANLFRICQWKFWLRQEVTIPWPRGTLPDSNISSSDPNEFYRYWLEANVGRQGWEWDWRVGSKIDGDNWGSLLLKFRDPKHATLFVMKHT